MGCAHGNGSERRLSIRFVWLGACWSGGGFLGGLGIFGDWLLLFLVVGAEVAVEFTEEAEESGGGGGLVADEESALGRGIDDWGYVVVECGIG